MTDNVAKIIDPSEPERASPEGDPLGFLSQEYTRWGIVFAGQPALTQRFLESQARKLAEALLQPLSQVRFDLPDQVVVEPSPAHEAGNSRPVPAEMREQLAGGLMGRLTRTGLSVDLRQRLDELEAASHPAVATSAGLIRYATAIHMVHRMLPAGRSVAYVSIEGEEIPSIPLADALEPDSAILARTDAIVEAEPGNGLEESRGELLVPYVPAARRFYLPQWVAFDDQDGLLVNSSSEAEAYLASMQQFLKVLHAAVALAPYIVSDGQYQQKRYGMLGQLVNQGRALARYETRAIIETIRRRAAAHDLNRGLSLSLPYFDDQALALRTLEFDVIPAGRIMFVPAFVVLAARKEQVKVNQDTRLSRSTRKHLLIELQMLEGNFDAEAQK
jgi:hypothetical protein